MSSHSTELSDLRVSIDRVVYFHEKKQLPGDKPHAFIYFITINNLTTRQITLLGRKWVIAYEDGKRDVIEGERIVGEEPLIMPGGRYSYNSYHVTDRSAVASGSFHGIDEHGEPVHCKIPEFKLTAPGEAADA